MTHPSIHPSHVVAIEHVCPIDLAPLPAVAPATDDQIRNAVEAARQARPGWSETAFDDRAKALTAAAKSLLARRQEAIELVRAEVGKLDVEALFDEGIGHLDMLQQWIRVTRTALRRKRARMNPIAFPGKRGYTDLVPRGVIGVIAPWNFPIAGLYRSVYPALLCGNAVIVKPSEYTPRTTQWFVDALAAELPPGVISVVQGDGSRGAALIEAGIDACAFTGSPRTGRAIAARCAERGIPSSIEMGGKDCAIVLADCDLRAHRRGHHPLGARERRPGMRRDRDRATSRSTSPTSSSLTSPRRGSGCASVATGSPRSRRSAIAGSST